MDRMIYTALSGASQMLERQSVSAHNLANADTPGFKSQLSMFRAVPVNGSGLATRAITSETTPGANLAAGSIQETGRKLDVAIDGPGWLAVEADDGSEGYTRNGDLQIDETGMLRSGGHRLLDDSGQPILLPQNANVSIAEDGTVSALPAGQPPNTIIQVATIKRVADVPGGMQRAPDGLFRPADPAQGGRLAHAPEIGLVTESLEQSNVSPIETMVSMIADARQFDMQMKTLSSADQNERGANKLLDVT